MYCCIKRNVLAGCVLLLLAFAESGATEPAAANDDNLIRFRSQGSSRYEIEGTNIIAVVWGGVELEYLGYLLVAEELRYNQATGWGEATGGVQVSTPEMSFGTEEVEFNGLEGWLRFTRNITGSVSSPAMSFVAGSGELKFPPGESVKDLTDISVSLSGGVEIRTGENHVLNSEGFSYEGNTGLISSMGAVQIQLSNQQIEAEDGQLFPGVSGAEITAQTVSAYLDAGGDFTEGLLEGVELTSRSVTVTADATRILPAGDFAAETKTWLVRIEGNPIRGMIQQDNPLGFTALYLAAEISDTGVTSMELQGGIELSYGETVITSELIELHRRADGYHVQIPGSLRARFNLDDVLTGEPMEKGSIEQWFSR